MKKNTFANLLALCCLIALLNSCDSRDDFQKDETAILITAKEVTDIRHNSARSGGELVIDGPVSVSSKEILWGTSSEVKFGAHEGATSTGTYPGEFSARLTQLNPNTDYFVRAFVNHQEGTTHGNEINFKTLGSDAGEITESGVPCPEMPVLTDPRDGKTYNTVLIGNQCWMKENLNFEVENSWCYKRNSENCDDFGRLYTWYAATGIEEGDQSGPGSVQGVCPPGWHLPKDYEWSAMEDLLDSKFNNEYDEWDKFGYRGFDAGRNLKSNIGWDCEGNGVDLVGFSALPGGRRFLYGQYYTGGSYGYWWTASDRSEENAYCRYLYYNSDMVFRYYFSKGSGLSVRCVKD
jgi:uncharacterized protein (TIGR02145 family)